VVPVDPLSLESLSLESAALGPDEPLELPELPESLLAPDEPPEPPPPSPPDACAWLMFTTAGATYTAVASSPSFLMISRRSMSRPPILFSLKTQDCVFLPDGNLTGTGRSSTRMIYRMFSLMNR
jgi:hypothetical protein